MAKFILKRKQFKSSTLISRPLECAFTPNNQHINI